ncbi:MAG: hypothetical protein ACN4GW_05430 [Desulforhopalus sp.]
MDKEEALILHCSGCGIEIDRAVEEVVVYGKLHFCLWCWSNDCCRVTKDVVEANKIPKIKP